MNRTDRQFSSGPPQSQGWLLDLRWRITAQQQLSICSSHWMMFLADQFEFSSKKKAVLHLVYPTGDVQRALLQWATASSLPQRFYAWTNWKIKNQLQLTGALWAQSTETRKARSHIGNSYFLAFSLLCLEVSRRYWTYPLQKSNPFILCEHFYETA